jgi:phospholipid transport system substrate-binding protein
MHAILRRVLAIFGFSLLIGIAALALAQTQAPAPASNVAATPEQAAQTPAGKFIQDLGNRAIGVIADKSLTAEQRSSKYNGLLHEAFDLPTIGHFVLGRAWNTATPQQQQEYMKLFEAIVVKMYGDRLSFYSGESFHVKGVRQENDKDSVVTSEIDHPGGSQPTSVDWRVRQNDGKFVIVDVSVEGVSQSVTQRDEYASILQRNNGNIDALLNLMRERLQNPTPPPPSSG